MRKQSVDELIALCTELKVHYVQLKDMHLPRTSAPAEIESTLAKFRAADIAITGGGIINWATPDEAAIRKDFVFARVARYPLIVASPEPATLDVVDKLAKEFKMPIAIHNHGPEDKHYKTPLDVLAAIKKRDKLLGCCMDVGHTLRSGVDPVAMVAALGNRLMDLHMKDVTRKPDGTWTQVEVGRGQVDVVALLRVLAKRKFQGHVALEYEINDKAPQSGIKESLAYLRGVVATITG